VTPLLLVAAAALAAVAAAGILHPFRRGRAAAPELIDPLEDERSGLVSALRDLDRERATGLLADPEYRALRTETERRAVAVLRALEARDGNGQLATELRQLRPRQSEAGRSRRALLATAVGAAVLVAVLVPVLTRAVENRSAGQPLSGDPAQTDPLAYYLDRVRQYPKDVAARLDLADAYLRVGDVQHSVEQYLATLKIDPKNPEALATLGFLLHRGGKSQEGLDAVNGALESAPGLPEALYYKGVILLDGLDRPAEAADALRAYLAAAPFDTAERRAEAQKLLAQAEREAAAGRSEAGG
jgi:tetratricopeptide (TPR) repeat protein